MTDMLRESYRMWENGASPEMIRQAEKEARMRRIEKKKEISARRHSLIDVYDKTYELTPRDTVDNLVGDIGFDDAVLAVAEALNAHDIGDGRITTKNFDWAAKIEGAADRDTLNYLGFYSLTAWIHPAHLNQIANEMRRWKEDKENDEN